MNTMRHGLFGLLISLTGCAAYYPQAGGYGYGVDQGYGYAVGIPAPVYSAYVGPAVSVGYRRPVYAPVYAPVWRGGPGHGGHESRGYERHDGHSPREHHRG
ncbi:MAG: hypothetical protein WCP99_02530 [Burkholderiales bacterium]